MKTLTVAIQRYDDEFGCVIGRTNVSIAGIDNIINYIGKNITKILCDHIRIISII